MKLSAEINKIRAKRLCEVMDFLELSNGELSEMVYANKTAISKYRKGEITVTNNFIDRLLELPDFKDINRKYLLGLPNENMFSCLSDRYNPNESIFKMFECSLNTFGKSYILNDENNIVIIDNASGEVSAVINSDIFLEYADYIEKQSNFFIFDLLTKK